MRTEIEKSRTNGFQRILNEIIIISNANLSKRTVYRLSTIYTEHNRLRNNNVIRSICIVLRKIAISKVMKCSVQAIRQLVLL